MKPVFFTANCLTPPPPRTISSVTRFIWKYTGLQWNSPHIQNLSHMTDIFKFEPSPTQARDKNDSQKNTSLLYTATQELIGYLQGERGSKYCHPQIPPRRIQVGSRNIDTLVTHTHSFLRSSKTTHSRHSFALRIFFSLFLIWLIAVVDAGWAKNPLIPLRMDPGPVLVLTAIWELRYEWIGLHGCFWGKWREGRMKQ